jgi:hypothetical protein
VTLVVVDLASGEFNTGATCVCSAVCVFSRQPGITVAATANIKKLKTPCRNNQYWPDVFVISNVLVFEVVRIRLSNGKIPIRYDAASQLCFSHTNRWVDAFVVEAERMVQRF